VRFPQQALLLLGPARFTGPDRRQDLRSVFLQLGLWNRTGSQRCAATWFGAGRWGMACLYVDRSYLQSKNNGLAHPVRVVSRWHQFVMERRSRLRPSRKLVSGTAAWAASVSPTNPNGFPPGQILDPAIPG